MITANYYRWSHMMRTDEYRWWLQVIEYDDYSCLNIMITDEKIIENEYWWYQMMINDTYRLFNVMATDEYRWRVKMIADYNHRKF